MHKWGYVDSGLGAEWARDIPTTEGSARKSVWRFLAPETTTRYDHPSPHSELPGSDVKVGVKKDTDLARVARPRK